MTAQIYHLRDYKTRQEREMEIERIGLAIIADALAPQDDEDDLPKWPGFPDSGDAIA